MFKNKKYLFSLIISSLIQSALIGNESLSEYVKTEFLRSLPVEYVVQPAAETEDLSWLGRMKKTINTMIPKANPLVINTHDMFELAFEKITTQNNKPFLTKHSIDKLNLALGKPHFSNSLYNTIFSNYIKTVGGTAHSMMSFTQPTTDIQELIRRQEAIKYLANTNTTTKKLALSFEVLSKHDKGLYSFYHATPLIQKEFEASIYFNIPVLKKCNTKPIPLELAKYLDYSLKTVLNSISLMYPIVVTKFSSGCLWRDAFPIYIANLKNIANPDQDFIMTLLTINSTLITPFISTQNLYTTNVQLKNAEEGVSAIHRALIDVASYTNELKKIRTIIQNNPLLLNSIPTLQNIIDLFDNTKHSADFNKLLSILDTNTFKKEPSFFSFTGRVKAAYKIIQEVKDEFLPALQAAAELETYTALAQMMLDHQNTNGTYCFAEFSQEGPTINAINFWNPFIQADHVVTNSIHLGSNNIHNVILTGPNTGGKTTVIKGLIIAALLAQTFGIAPAESFIISPFSQLNCFMDISDDIASGTSLFKAEVLRAKELINLSKELKPNEYALTIMDEIFTSTSPQEGEAAATLFAQKLGTFNNTITILATHYPKLTALETGDNQFKNFHVEVIRNLDNSLNRTFKLKTGPSFMNIALDILQDEDVL